MGLAVVRRADNERGLGRRVVEVQVVARLARCDDAARLDVRAGALHELAGLGLERLERLHRAVRRRVDDELHHRISVGIVHLLRAPGVVLALVELEDGAPPVQS